jgi:hypothetical protein
VGLIGTVRPIRTPDRRCQLPEGSVVVDDRRLRDRRVRRQTGDRSRQLEVRDRGAGTRAWTPLAGMQDLVERQATLLQTVPQVDLATGPRRHCRHYDERTLLDVLNADNGTNPRNLIQADR